MSGRSRKRNIESESDEGVSSSLDWKITEREGKIEETSQALDSEIPSKIEEKTQKEGSDTEDEQKEPVSKRSPKKQKTSGIKEKEKSSLPNHHEEMQNVSLRRSAGEDEKGDDNKVMKRVASSGIPPLPSKEISRRDAEQKRDDLNRTPSMEVLLLPTSKRAVEFTNEEVAAKAEAPSPRKSFKEEQEEYLAQIKKRRDQEKEDEEFAKRLAAGIEEVEKVEPPEIANKNKKIAELSDYELAVKFSKELEEQDKKKLEREKEEKDRKEAEAKGESYKIHKIALVEPKKEEKAPIVDDGSEDDYIKKKKQQEEEDFKLAMELSKESEEVEKKEKKEDKGEERKEEKEEKSKEYKHTLEIEFPKYWEHQSTDSQIFQVKEDTTEYQSIVDRFNETLPHAKIKKIERNQNRKLWMWYLLRRQEVAKKNKNGPNEKFLFHGSRANAYSTIQKDGFDFRVALLSGSIGAGIYFAPDSSTSSGYALPAAVPGLIPAPLGGGGYVGAYGGPYGYGGGFGGGLGFGAAPLVSFAAAEKSNVNVSCYFRINWSWKAWIKKTSGA